MNNTLILTPAAIQYLQENLASSPAGTLGVRVGLRDAGCSGYAYTIDFTNEQLPDDHILTFDTIKIFMSEKHIKAFHGTEVDFVEEGLNSTLEFNNPNVVQECGCGESFQFKDDAAVI
jgi:iron-sulfur cluster assembly accessory protein